MNQVYVLETFEDIEKAFSRVRSSGDSTPSVENSDRLEIHGDSLTLKSKRFVLGENVRVSGNAFVRHCIGRVLGSQFSADRLNT